MAIAIPALILIVVAFALPNYLAVRLGVFGGGALAASPEAAQTAPAAPVAAPTAARARRQRISPKFTRGGYLWKALSPMLFAVGLIFGIALGGVAGTVITVGTFLNMVLGFMGWDFNFVGGKRQY